LSVECRNKIKGTLAANGFTEVYNYSFIGEKELSNVGTGNKHYLELANPLSSEHKYLRLSLVPSILNNISENSRTLAEENIKIFELGKVYYRRYMGHNTCMLEGAAVPSEVGTSEKLMLVGAVYDKNSKELFYRTKESVELLLNFLGIKNTVYTAVSEQCEHMPVWHLGRTAYLSVDQNVIGITGEIDHKTRVKFKIEGRVGLFNLDFRKIVSLASAGNVVYDKFSKFPSVKHDLAVLAPKKILWSEIEKLVYSAGGGLVKNIELFDIYEGKNIITDSLAGKRSLAFHIVFQSQEKTLKDEDVKIATDRIIEELKNKLGVNLRR
jgi:phenylalanyl-tRNA synthetase beta chain